MAEPLTLKLAIEYDQASGAVAVRGIERLDQSLDEAGKSAAQAGEKGQAGLSGIGSAADREAEEVAAAFRRLGIKSQAELDRLAASAKADFERIRESGTSTPADMERAWTAYQERIADTSQGATKHAAGLSDALGGIKGQLLGMASIGALTALSAQLVEAGTAAQNLRTRLVFAAGGDQEADLVMRQLAATADELGLSVVDLTDTYIRLKNLGLDPSREALTAYANIAAVNGKSSMDFAEAVADAITGEFERLKEFGIKASVEGEQVALRFKGQTIRMANDAKTIEMALIKLGTTDFAGAAASSADNASVAMEQMGDSVKRLVGQMAEDSGLLDNLTAWAKRIADFSNALSADAVPAQDAAAQSMDRMRKSFLEGGLALPGFTDIMSGTTRELDRMGFSLSHLIAWATAQIKADKGLADGSRELADATQLVADAQTGAAAAAKAQTEQQRMLAEQMKEVADADPKAAEKVAALAAAIGRSLKITLDGATAARELAAAKDQMGIAAARAAGQERTAVELTAQAQDQAVKRAEEAQRQAQLEVAQAKSELETLKQIKAAKAEDLDQARAVVTAKQAAANAAALAVEASKQEAQAARLAAVTYGDQSASLGRLMDARRDLMQRERELTAAQAAGQDVEAALLVVRRQLGEVTVMLADAAKDAAAATDREIGANERSNRITQARIDLKLEELRREQALAQAAGDTLKVQQIAVAIAAAEARASGANAEAKAREADMLRRKADAMEAAAQADNNYTSAEHAAVDAMRDSATLADLEAQKLGISTKAKEDSARAANDLATQMDNLKQAIGSAASSAEVTALGDALEAAMDKGILSLEQYQTLLGQMGKGGASSGGSSGGSSSGGWKSSADISDDELAARGVSREEYNSGITRRVTLAAPTERPGDGSGGGARLGSFGARTAATTGSSTPAPIIINLSIEGQDSVRMAASARGARVGGVV